MPRLTKFTDPFITPAPDYSIVSENGNDVWVLCPDERSMYEVINWLQAQRGGDWIARTYFSEQINENPRLGNRGWMWRMVKI